MLVWTDTGRFSGRGGDALTQGVQRWHLPLGGGSGSPAAADVVPWGAGRCPPPALPGRSPSGAAPQAGQALKSSRGGGGRAF